MLFIFGNFYTHILNRRCSFLALSSLQISPSNKIFVMFLISSIYFWLLEFSSLHLYFPSLLAFFFFFYFFIIAFSILIRVVFNPWFDNCSILVISCLVMMLTMWIFCSLVYIYNWKVSKIYYIEWTTVNKL